MNRTKSLWYVATPSTKKGVADGPTTTFDINRRRINRLLDARREQQLLADALDDPLFTSGYSTDDGPFSNARNN